MDKTTVAVILITYNQEQYVSQTIDSLISQKCDTPFKIYANDDCSKDRTSDILKEYASRYPELIDLQINQNNLGIVGNYFNAINRSHSDYIAVCAGDDWWCDENKLQKQVDFMHEHPECGMLYTGYKQYKDGKYEEMPLMKRKDFDDIVTNGNMVPAVTMFMRRELVKQYQDEIHPLEHDWGMEDQPLVLWFSLNSKIMCIPDITSVYRIAEGSAYRSSLDKIIAMSLRSFNLFVYFIKLSNKESLLKTIQRRHVTTMIYRYITHNVPVDISVCHKVGKIRNCGFKMMLYTLLSYCPVTRKMLYKHITKQ